MTDSDWAIIRQWLLSDGAQLTPDELIDLMRPEKLRELVAKLREGQKP